MTYRTFCTDLLTGYLKRGRIVAIGVDIVVDGGVGNDLLGLGLADAGGGASGRRAGCRRPDEGADRSIVRRRRVVRAEVDGGLRFRRGVLDLCRRNEKILVVTRKDLRISNAKM